MPPNGGGRIGEGPRSSIISSRKREKEIDKLASEDFKANRQWKALYSEYDDMRSALREPSAPKLFAQSQNSENEVIGG